MRTRGETGNDEGGTLYRKQALRPQPLRGIRHNLPSYGNPLSLSIPAPAPTTLCGHLSWVRLIRTPGTHCHSPAIVLVATHAGIQVTGGD